MKKQILLLLAALVCGVRTLLAVPAYPGRIVYTQPDGTKIVLERHGDEFGHWTTDAAGRTVRLHADGFFREVTDADPDDVRRQAASRRMRTRQASVNRADGHIALGQKHFLVILVEFSDLSFTTSDDPQAAYARQLNEPGYSENGATGSARDFYFDNSNGLFEPIFDVYGPVKLSKKYSYYGGNDSGGNDKNPEEAVIEGCKALDGEIDFTRYDNDGDGCVDMVFMYYAGYGEADSSDDNSIWPHMWELSGAGVNVSQDGVRLDRYACSNEIAGQGALQGRMAGIGTACHEFGHAMGLPDMYDTDYYTNGLAGALYSYSTMCSGSYNNEGRTPPYFNFEERIYLGWLTENDYREFPRAGTYTIPPINENVAYRTYTDMDGEYFIYENRTKSGWDRYIPAGGMVVYHADKSDRQVRIAYYSTTARSLWENWEQDNSINENGSHPCFYIVPAGQQGSLNTWYESRIPFPYNNVNTYVPVSWNGVEGDVVFSRIAYTGGTVTVVVQASYDGLTADTIADPGSYKAGDRFVFSLNEEADERPVSVSWLFDDEPVGADSVILTSGAHTVEAVLTFADGRKQTLTLELDVE